MHHKYNLSSKDAFYIIDFAARIFLGSMLPQYMALSVRFVHVSKKNYYATSEEGSRLRFGMLIVLTNIRSFKVLGTS